jgi:hypothetical protein
MNTASKMIQVHLLLEAQIKVLMSDPISIRYNVDFDVYDRCPINSANLLDNVVSTHPRIVREHEGTYLLNSARDFLECNARRYIGTGFCRRTRDKDKRICSLLVVQLEYVFSAVQSVPGCAWTVYGHHFPSPWHERTDHDMIVNFRFFIPSNLSVEEDADREPIVHLR